MSGSREGFNLLGRPKLLFKKRNWKWSKKLMFYDTIKPLICLFKGHKIHTTDDFNSEYSSIPNFVCGFTVIRHYWLTCNFCHHYLPKEKLTKRDKLITLLKRNLT